MGTMSPSEAFDMSSDCSAIIIPWKTGDIHKRFSAILFHKGLFAPMVNSNYAQTQSATANRCCEMAKSTSCA
jgi:hypothetical protein